MTRAWCFALVLIPAFTGCIVAVHEPHPRRTTYVAGDDDRAHDAPSGTVWVVRAEHRHDPDCGHYWYNGTWYEMRRHRHAPGCGHILHFGNWVLAGPVGLVAGHVHTAHCGHYHHDGAWYYMRNHAHGPGCGHQWNGHFWIAVRW